MWFPAFLQAARGCQEEMQSHTHPAVPQLLLLFNTQQINEKFKPPALQGSQTCCTVRVVMTLKAAAGNTHSADNRFLFSEVFFPKVCCASRP